MSSIIFCVWSIKKKFCVILLFIYCSFSGNRILSFIAVFPYLRFVSYFRWTFLHVLDPVIQLVNALKCDPKLEKINKKVDLDQHINRKWSDLVINTMLGWTQNNYQVYLGVIHETYWMKKMCVYFWKWNEMNWVYGLVLHCEHAHLYLGGCSHYINKQPVKTKSSVPLLSV